jgi:hypothetical protein
MASGSHLEKLSAEDSSFVGLIEGAISLEFRTLVQPRVPEGCILTGYGPQALSFRRWLNLWIQQTLLRCPQGMAMSPTLPLVWRPFSLFFAMSIWAISICWSCTLLWTFNCRSSSLLTTSSAPGLPICLNGSAHMLKSWLRH